MQETFIVFGILVVFGLLHVDGRQFESCSEERVTNLYGELSYRRPRNNRKTNEQCDWTFSYLGYKADYVVVLDFAFLYQGSNKNNSVQLPSDAILSEEVQFPPCQAYYNASSPLSDCLLNLTRLYCSEEPIPVTTWPPKMVTRNYRSSSLHFEMSYVYVTCPIVVEEPQNIIRESTSPNTSVDNINIDKEILFIIVIVLGALLLISVFALFVLLCKFRRQKKIEKVSMSDLSNSSPMVMMGGSRDNQAYEEIVAHQVVSSIYDTPTEHEYALDLTETSIYQHLS